MRIEGNTVNEYVENIREDHRSTIEKLRGLVLGVVPGAIKSIKYGMPTYDGDICAFAAQKHYFSLYIMNTLILEKHKSKLGYLNVGKSCIRFKRIEQLPLDNVRFLLVESVKKKKNDSNL